MRRRSFLAAVVALLGLFPRRADAAGSSSPDLSGIWFHGQAEARYRLPSGWQLIVEWEVRAPLEQEEQFLEHLRRERSRIAAEIGSPAPEHCTRTERFRPPAPPQDPECGRLQVRARTVLN